MRLRAPDDRSRVSGVASSCKLSVCCFKCNWRTARCIVLMIGLRWAAYWITRGLAINPANPPWANELTLCTKIVLVVQYFQIMAHNTLSCEPA